MNRQRQELVSVVARVADELETLRNVPERELMLEKIDELVALLDGALEGYDESAAEDA